MENQWWPLVIPAVLFYVVIQRQRNKLAQKMLSSRLRAISTGISQQSFEEIGADYVVDRGNTERHFNSDGLSIVYGHMSAGRDCVDTVLRFADGCNERLILVYKEGEVVFWKRNELSFHNKALTPSEDFLAKEILEKIQQLCTRFPLPDPNPA